MWRSGETPANVAKYDWSVAMKCQLAAYSRVARMSLRRASNVETGASYAVTTAVTRSSSTTAGSRRRARRAQNSAKRMRPRARRSCSSSEVMR